MAVTGQEAVTLSQIKDIFNSAYPVGSIYLATGDVSPSQVWGGVWERLNDGFLYSSPPDAEDFTFGTDGWAANQNTRQAICVVAYRRVS